MADVAARRQKQPMHSPSVTTTGSWTTCPEQSPCPGRCPAGPAGQGTAGLASWMEDPVPDRELGGRILEEMSKTTELLGYTTK